MAALTARAACRQAVAMPDATVGQPDATVQTAAQGVASVGMTAVEVRTEEMATVVATAIAEAVTDWYLR